MVVERSGFCSALDGAESVRSMLPTTWPAVFLTWKLAGASEDQLQSLASGSVMTISQCWVSSALAPKVIAPCSGDRLLRSAAEQPNTTRSPGCPV